MAEEDRYSRMATLSGTAQTDTKVKAPKSEGAMTKFIREWLNKKSTKAAPETWREVDEDTGTYKYYRMGANGEKEEVQGRGI